MSIAWIGALIVGVSLILGIGSRFVFKKTDNQIEEISEKVIQKIVEKCLAGDINIDLSPDTPDPDGKSLVMDEPILIGVEWSQNADKALTDLQSIIPDETVYKDDVCKI